MGFGGSFTEAAAITFSQMPDNLKKQAIDAYFSEDGLRYNLGRATIHSSDFSEKSRTYIDEYDDSLESFSIEEDELAIIPLMKAAKKVAGDIFITSAPWSPPAFMKTNEEMYFGGKLKKEYYPIWAKYLVKYVLEMKKRGIDISAMSVQNEPEANQVWESCHYTAQEELEMVKHLHKEIENAGLDVKITIWDHNRDIAAERVHAILKEIPDKVWGVAYHWYVNEDSENLSVIHDLYPNHHIIFTEGCIEFTNTAVNSNPNGEDVWKNGQWYGRNIIKDSLNYSEGFIEWNLFVNEEGGPNHVQNFCEAPIMYDRSSKKLLFKPSYYVIGHFSKYVDKGAKRIHISRTIDKDIYSTAYKNPDQSIVIIIQNEGWVKQFTMVVDEKSVDISLPGQSISTYIVI
jgi:glucosylceramidase